MDLAEVVLFKDRVFLSPRLERLEVEEVFCDCETPVPRAREERRGESGAIEAVGWWEEGRRGARRGEKRGREVKKLGKRCFWTRLAFGYLARSIAGL